MILMSSLAVQKVIIVNKIKIIRIYVLSLFTEAIILSWSTRDWGGTGRKNSVATSQT